MADVPQEREAKLEAGMSFQMPSLEPAGVRCEDRGVRVLDTVYWDIDDGGREPVLFRMGLGLRHRTVDGSGGVWTLKGPTSHEGNFLARDELEIEGGDASPPQEMLECLPAGIDAERLRPVAHLRSHRRVIDVFDSRGSHIAELADDSVEVLDGDRVAATFRELEIEERAFTGARTHLEGIVRILRGAGARDPADGSKYARALDALRH